MTCIKCIGNENIISIDSFVEQQFPMYVILTHCFELKPDEKLISQKIYLRQIS